MCGNPYEISTMYLIPKIDIDLFIRDIRSVMNAPHRYGYLFDVHSGCDIPHGYSSCRWTSISMWDIHNECSYSAWMQFTDISHEHGSGVFVLDIRLGYGHKLWVSILLVNVYHRDLYTGYPSGIYPWWLSYLLWISLTLTPTLNPTDATVPPSREWLVWGAKCTNYPKWRKPSTPSTWECLGSFLPSWPVWGAQGHFPGPFLWDSFRVGFGGVIASSLTPTLSQNMDIPCWYQAWTWLSHISIMDMDIPYGYLTGSSIVDIHDTHHGVFMTMRDVAHVLCTSMRHPDGVPA